MSFNPIVALGRTYTVHFTGSTPQSLRLYLLNSKDLAVGTAANPTEVVVRIWYDAPNRLQVFDVDTETFIEDQNVLDGIPKADLVRRGKLLGNGVDPRTGEQTWEHRDVTLAQPRGTNTFHRPSKTLTLLVRGDRPLEIRTMPVVFVSMGLSVSEEDFYEIQDQFVENLAHMLGIPFDRYTQTGLFPIAYTVGTDFRKAWRKPVDEVVSWNGFPA